MDVLNVIQSKEPLTFILVAYIDMDRDEIVRDPDEAKRREVAGAKMKGLYRFPFAGELLPVEGGER